MSTNLKRKMPPKLIKFKSLPVKTLSRKNWENYLNTIASLIKSRANITLNS